MCHVRTKLDEKVPYVSHARSMWKGKIVATEGCLLLCNPGNKCPAGPAEPFVSRSTGWRVCHGRWELKREEST